MDSATIVVNCLMLGIIGWAVVSAVVDIVRGEFKIRRQYTQIVDLVKRSREPVRFWLWVGLRLFLGVCFFGVMVYLLVI